MLLYLNKNGKISFEDWNIKEINSNFIKTKYIELLNTFDKNEYNEIKNIFNKTVSPLYNSSIYISSSDAHTLTDGPTIYMADNVDKISLFCLQQNKISKDVYSSLIKNLTINNEHYSSIEKLINQIEDTDDNDKQLKYTLETKIKQIKNKLHKISIPDKYIPNTKAHKAVWCKNNKSNSFIANIDEEDSTNILQIDDIDIKWKILLLMGYRSI